MKMEITERDKKLLIFLSLFIIVVCIGYWGILPQVKKYNTYKTEIEEQQNIKDLNELKIMQVSVLEVDNSKMEERILSAREQYYPIMSSNEIDKYFTSMVLDYGLYAFDMNINIDDSETTLEPYIYSEKALLKDEEQIESTVSTDTNESQIDEALAEGGQTDIIYENLGTGNTGIYSAAVDMRLGGDYETLQKLINDLSVTSKKLKVCNYSWNKEKVMETKADDESGVIYDYDIVDNYVLNISVEIYMCEE